MKKLEQSIDRRSYPIDAILRHSLFLVSVLSLGNFLFTTEVVAREHNQKKPEKHSVNTENKNDLQDTNEPDGILVKGYTDTGLTGIKQNVRLKDIPATINNVSSV
ncbi:TonB-dependent siderophore receptor [Leptospira santarosai]|uniref:TonB-dependent siderophore receptor n=1 Tax=Leptospira santarosai TaxID=28183 RepID=A0A2P1QXC8_9LEPT|nr:TonB-dependent siderophore receptor [Leptospira santarosai]